MNSAIPVFETATAQTLNPRGYLLANKDLRQAFGDDEALARQHFSEYGLAEKRRQITAAALASRREKFLRFKPTLRECGGDQFPIQFGNRVYRIEDYADESAGEYGYWHEELDANPDKLYADIGAGLRSLVWPNCAYLEVYPSTTADIIVEPGSPLPFRGSSLDGIGCFAVLEHVTRPWDLATEFARVLKPGGKVFIDWPFLQPVHGFPSHYYNATREGLKSLFSGDFEIERLYTGHHQGPDYTTHWILNSLLRSVKDDEARERLAAMTIGDLCKETPGSAHWRSLLSTMDDQDISTLSCGNTLFGRRRD